MAKGEEDAFVVSPENVERFFSLLPLGFQQHLGVVGYTGCLGIWGDCAGLYRLVYTDHIL